MKCDWCGRATTPDTSDEVAGVVFCQRSSCREKYRQVCAEEEIEV